MTITLTEQGGQELNDELLPESERRLSWCAHCCKRYTHSAKNNSFVI